MFRQSEAGPDVYRYLLSVLFLPTPTNYAFHTYSAAGRL